MHDVIVLSEPGLTKGGYSVTFTSNYLGHYKLTNELYDIIKVRLLGRLHVCLAYRCSSVECLVFSSSRLCRTHQARA